MGANAEKLMSHMQSGTGYDQPYEDIRDAQVAALQERFEQRVDKIKLVGLRAGDAQVQF